MENIQQNSLYETQWYHYLLAFLAGVFAINILPHYINGIIGKPFPTPFATPPGIGLSSPELNVLWALINFLISFSILYFAKIGQRKKMVWVAFFVGAVLMSFNLANYFGGLHL